MDLQTLTASILQVELFCCGLFAEAFFRYIQNLTAGIDLQRGNHIIPFIQGDSLYAGGCSAHGSCICFGELDAHTFSCGNENLIVFIHFHNRDQVIIFTEIQGDQTGFTDVRKHGHICFLDDTLFCDHRQIFILAEFSDGNASHDLFIGADFQQVYDGDTPAGSACFGDLIALDAVNLTFICEEQQRIVSGSQEQVFHIVLFSCLHADDAAAAAVLALIGIQRGTFHIVQVGQCKYAGFFINQVFYVDLTGVLDEFCSSFISVFFTDGCDLIFDDTQQQFFICQNGFIICDFSLQFRIFRIDLFFFQTLQSSQLHFQDCLCLHIRQTKAFHQSFFRIIIACSDNSDDFINVIDGDTQTFQDMGSLFRLIQIKSCSSGHNIFLMLQIFFQSLFQIQDDRFSVNQCQHICTERFLQRCIFIQLVQDNIGIGIFFHFNDDLDIITGGCIVQIADAFHTFVFHQFCDLFDQTQFIDHVRDLCYHDTFSAVVFFNLRCGTHNDLAAACSVSRTDAALAQDIRACGEVGAFDVFHQFFHICFPAIDLVIDHADDTIDDLAQVMGRDIGRHTNGDTAGTIHQ